jgi:hypothetical protein
MSTHISRDLETWFTSNKMVNIWSSNIDVHYQWT